MSEVTDRGAVRAASGDADFTRATETDGELTALLRRVAQPSGPGSEMLT